MTRSEDHDGIAVVGMGCKFPGADSVEEYWNLLDAGQSMVTDVPSGRFPGKEHKRSLEKSVFFGNYLDDIASFDNRFFKKSGREAASMDPQQRLLLEVSYQALESAGFFGPREQDLDVGIYVGVCASDYNDNVASHPPNAFSTLGTLRAFLTGRISHYFGLTGPSITYDTACSSSAVAIDAACKAILLGDCTSAIAGGVSIFTSPHFYQNLAAASFLSQTGPTKSFDSRADGYCRGEGIGLVVLKRLSKAIADGDNIIGTILSTSVKQNSNKVPITVPYSPSQTELYRKVLTMAGVAPEEVTYLEAHGTGTPIGDVLEFESIRETFQSTKRRQPLHVASAKGNIGHTEGASGVASLIKTLLMMQKRQIPRQANYIRTNPKINLIPGQFAIPTQTVPWTADTLISCVNNYGAAGSIAAMVVKETPRSYTALSPSRPLPKYPVIVSANSAKSLSAYCGKLREFISSPQVQLPDVAFNLSEKQNRALPHMFATTVSSIQDLDDQLRSAAANPEKHLNNLKQKPVILTFGGQTTRSIGLSRDVYESSTLLRKYLDECDSTLKSLGYSRGIYPAIFDTKPQDDVVALQTSQFALHYACAQSWIASGLKVDCVLGHSFGQLVALTVSGVLSMADGLKLVYGRAVLMRDRWGPERGSMIALEADEAETKALIASVRMKSPGSPIPEVACYNGPRSHVLVGSVGAIESVVETLERTTPGAKYKVLNVTHGFHSTFCDPILRELEGLAGGLTFNKPTIPIETTSEGESWLIPTPKLIAEHTRAPVYFGQAVKRIESRLGPCTWVEAGSNSSVTSMVRRALPDSAGHLYCPVNLTRDDAMGAVADTTAKLWQNGHHVQFWPFHRSQRQAYRSLNLPPYQFEKTRHWLDFNLDTEKESKAAAPKIEAPPEPVPEPDPVFITFSGFQDSERKRAVFTIDPRADEWQALLQGHAVLQEPLCPAPLYVELVTRAATEVAAAKGISCAQFARLDGLEIISALGASQDKIITLILSQVDYTGFKYDFTFQAQPRNASAESASTHAVGKVEITSVDDHSITADFERMGKLLKYHNLEDIAASPNGEAASGTLIYKVFSRVVQYHDFYKGVRKVASNEGVVVAEVSLPVTQPSAVQGLAANPVAIDNFLQVPGMYANCLAPCPSDEVFVCTHVDRVQLSPDFIRSSSNRWDVFAMSTPTSEKECNNDIFVKDHTTGKLVFIAFGANFHRVRISSLAKVISRANIIDDVAAASPVLHSSVPPAARAAPAAALATQEPAVKPSTYHQRAEAVAVQPRQSPANTQPTVSSFNASPQAELRAPATIDKPTEKPKGPGVEARLRDMLSAITDVPADQFQGSIQLEDLGIDSLMATEIVAEVQEIFKITIPQEHLQDLMTFAALRDYLDARTGGTSTAQPVSEEPSFVAPPVPAATTEARRNAFQSVQADPEIPDVPDVHQVPTKAQSSPNDEKTQELVSRLAQLLGEHLECEPSTFERSTILADCGLDSLLCMELMSDVQKLFGVSIDLAQLTMESNYGELVDIFLNAVAPGSTTTTTPSSTDGSTLAQSSGPMTPATDGDIYLDKSMLMTKGAFSSPVLATAPREFENVKADFDALADEYGFAGFYDKVHDKQVQLVLAYTVEAFADLGVDLNALRAGEEIPQIKVLPKHHHLRDALYHILREGKVADYDGRGYVRSDERISSVHSSTLFNDILREFPQHADEHKLLNMCGADLAKLMTGAKDALTTMYGSKANRTILENVYSTSPMYIIMSRLLTSFLEKSLSTSSPGPDGKFHILELGAGTGSTTRWVVERLVERGIPIEYTFTDISSALVTAAKRKFSKFNDSMKYATINIEKEPPLQYQGQFDIVLSTNCIHATSNLYNSLGNINKLLKPHGFVSLVEFTTRFFWFDLVFGLLDGWWLFDDGRPYVLATPEFWDKSMRSSGFNHVSWTGGRTRESEAVRVITGFKQPVENPALYQSIPQERSGGVETVVFGHTDKGLPLRADVHHPSPAQASLQESWTVGTV
jgi:acyl transferase domain-containing protein/acyl carrier protein/SAM-dependent methyltransferase